MLSTADTAGGFTWVRRRVKEQGTWCQKIVRKPTVVDNYVLTDTWQVWTDLIN